MTYLVAADLPSVPAGQRFRELVDRDLADAPAVPLAIAADIIRGEPADEVLTPGDLFDVPEAHHDDPAATAEGDDVAETMGADLSPEAHEPAEDESGAPPAEPMEAAPDRDEAPALAADESAPESMGGEAEPRDRRTTPRFLRNYKIQEVIRRRQILLIQVVKEERGSKGAALTTYISLAGRYSVLMPNSPRGGGISRKITSAADRRRLKEVTAELQLPRGMGMIVRTAGAARPKAEILRDGEYLLSQWDQIRDLTMKSMAPALIYEEANLIKRAIRDVYSRDVEDIQVDGEAGWRNARDFMRMLMPAHARKVQLWRDPQPLFAKMQVEAQLDSMLMPTVQLRSGGYLVINQTEALVAVDVNSGRSTKERGIEETALRTNMEAAAEVARQLRLRDLAGLIVIDFIDMEQRRHNAMVERELKEALKNDRARIQLGSISHFGLLEMSRQRLRPSLAETSFVPCAACGGTGHVRGTESAALTVLRAVEEEGAKRKSAEIVVHVAGAIAFYILNHKRLRLGEIEARYSMSVAFAADDTLRAPDVRIERVRAQTATELPAPVSGGGVPDARYAAIDAADALETEAPDEQDEAILLDEAEDAGAPAGEVRPVAGHPGETAAESEVRRRRRRRRGGRREDAAVAVAIPIEDGTPPEPSAEAEAEAEPAEAGPATVVATAGEDGAKRRSRRGGRRRRREPDGAPEAAETEEPVEAEAIMASYAPVWTGPTPADPFGGGATFDIFDAIEQAEEQRLSSQNPAPKPLQDAGIAEQHATAEAQSPAEIPAVIEQPVAQSSMPDLEPSATPPVEPDPDIGSDLPVEDPLPWTTPEPDSEPETVAAALVAEVPIEKRRGWWRR